MIYVRSFFGSKIDENCVSIAKGIPRGIVCKSYMPLAPTWEMINKWNSSNKSEKAWTEYSNMYIMNILKKLDVHKVASDMKEKSMMCWEKNESKCHRFIVKEWLESNGYEVRILGGRRCDHR